MIWLSDIDSHQQSLIFYKWKYCLVKWHNHNLNILLILRENVLLQLLHASSRDKIKQWVNIFLKNYQRPLTHLNSAHET